MSPAVRSGAVIAVGTALIAAPLMLGLSPAAMATGIAVGAIAVALGLAGTASEGRGTLPVASQAAYDRGLGVGLLGAGLAFGLAGELAALAVFGAVGLAALLVAALTRYSVSAA